MQNSCIASELGWKIITNHEQCTCLHYTPRRADASSVCAGATTNHTWNDVLGFVQRKTTEAGNKVNRGANSSAALNGGLVDVCGAGRRGRSLRWCSQQTFPGRIEEDFITARIFVAENRIAYLKELIRGQLPICSHMPKRAKMMPASISSMAIARHVRRGKQLNGARRWSG